jgi:hypothetical protein
MRRSATSERELLRQWNAGAPIDGRSQPPVWEQQHIDDYPDNYADDGLDEPDDWEEPAFGEDQCGWMGPRLGCSAAGTEECDWDCPVRASMRRRKRKKGNQ